MLRLEVLNMIKSVLLVGAGSCVGGMLRYFLLSIMKTPSSSFPLGVLLVNLLGCLLIGVIYGIFSRMPNASTEILLLLTTGVCGGFTTFSTFANDGLLMIQQQNWLPFLIYLSISVIGGILAVVAGNAIVGLCR